MSHNLISSDSYPERAKLIRAEMPSQDPSSSADNQRSAPEELAASSLLAAALLACAGGALDAFLYLNHGRVFAGAMTGNAVLCGVALLSHDLLGAIQHFLPLVAFFFGVWAAEALRHHLASHAVSVGLLLEALGLLACSFCPPRFPDFVFVPLIALLAAYQVAGFRKVDIYSYNSTFITGDLRTAVVGLYRALSPEHREEGLRQARELGLIILSFVLGAVGGAVLAPRVANRTLWFPALTLLLVLGLTLRRTRRLR